MTRIGRRPHQGAAAAAGTAAVGWALAFAGGCSTPPGEAAPAEPEAAPADHTTVRVERYFSRDGLMQAKLEADTLFMWDDSAHARVKGLVLVVYNQGGGRRARVTADEGRMGTMTDELQATGSAVLSIPSEEREVRSAELWFALERDSVWSDSSVVMLDRGCRVEGDGFGSDLAFDNLVIRGTRAGECPGR